MKKMFKIILWILRVLVTLHDMANKKKSDPSNTPPQGTK